MTGRPASTSCSNRRSGARRCSADPERQAAARRGDLPLRRFRGPRRARGSARRGVEVNLLLTRRAKGWKHKLDDLLQPAGEHGRPRSTLSPIRWSSTTRSTSSPTIARRSSPPSTSHPDASSPPVISSDDARPGRGPGHTAPVRGGLAAGGGGSVAGLSRPTDRRAGAGARRSRAGWRRCAQHAHHRSQDHRSGDPARSCGRAAAGVAVTVLGKGGPDPCGRTAS